MWNHLANVDNPKMIDDVSKEVDKDFPHGHAYNLFPKALEWPPLGEKKLKMSEYFDANWNLVTKLKQG